MNHFLMSSLFFLFMAILGGTAVASQPPLLEPGSLSLMQGQSRVVGSVRLTMQRDGNLVVSDNGKPLWASNTVGRCSSCRAVYQSDGNLVIYNDATKVAIFAKGFASVALSIKATAPHVEFVNWTMTPGSLELRQGQSFSKGVLKIAMQKDGNFVLYRGSQAIWASNTVGRCTNCRAVYQGDGNLVIYNEDTRNAVFAKGHGSKKMVLRSDSPYVDFLNSFPTIAEASTSPKRPVATTNVSQAAQPNISRAPASLPGPSTLSALDSEVSLGFHSVVRNASGTAQDFLFQKVCQDSSGRALPQDPATCSNRRNLRVGEPVPYILHDRAWNTTYMHLQNLPHLKGTALRSVSKRDFTSASVAPGIPRAVNDYDPLSDGYDIVELEGDLISAIGTTDPITLNDRFSWFGADCSRNDAWVHFPKFLSPGQNGSMIARLMGGVFCNSNSFSDSLTMWNRPSEPMTYTSGKRLETIQTFHYARHDTTQDLHHIEVFYHTNPYGLTRWERWETASGCADTAAMSGQTVEHRCGATALANQLKSGMCNGVVEASFFNQNFKRVDCRDWSYVEVLANPLHPYSTPLHLDFATSRNLLRSADFAGPSVSGWNKLGATGWAHTTDPKTNNVSLSIRCHGACNGNSLYQDVIPQAVVDDYGGGALRIQASVEISGAIGSTATVALWMFNRENISIPKRVEVTLKNTGKNTVSFSLPWDFSSRPLNAIRFEVYLHSQSEYQIDNAALAILPQN